MRVSSTIRLYRRAVDDAPSPLAHFTLHWTRTKVLEFVAREVLALPPLLSLCLRLLRSRSLPLSLCLQAEQQSGSDGFVTLFSFPFPSLLIFPRDH